MISLWPDSLGAAELPPFKVLVNQCNFYHPHGSRTEAHVAPNEIENKVKLVISGWKGEHVSIDFLEIHHANDYPCKVWWDGACRRALTQAKLIGILAEIFHSQKAANLLQDFNT